MFRRRFEWIYVVIIQGHTDDKSLFFNFFILFYLPEEQAYDVPTAQQTTKNYRAEKRTV